MLDNDLVQLSLYHTFFSFAYRDHIWIKERLKKKKWKFLFFSMDIAQNRDLQKKIMLIIVYPVASGRTALLEENQLQDIWHTIESKK